MELLVAHHPARKSRNPLLIKSSVGQCRHQSYALPGEDFAYGLRYSRDEVGVRESISMQPIANQGKTSSDESLAGAKNGQCKVSGKSQRASGKRILKKPASQKTSNFFVNEQNCVPSFAYTNMNSFNVRSKSASYYAKDKKLARKPEKPLVKLKLPNAGQTAGKLCSHHAVAKPLPSEVDPSYTYGKISVSSLPIHVLMVNHFGRKGEKELNERYKAMEQDDEAIRNGGTNYVHVNKVRNMELKPRRKQPSTPGLKLLKLKQFSGIKAKVECFQKKAQTHVITEAAEETK